MGHLTEQQTTYLAHLARAWRLAAGRVGGALVLTLVALFVAWLVLFSLTAALVFFVHGLLPFVFTRTGSRIGAAVDRAVDRAIDQW